MSEQEPASGPDFGAGILISEIGDGGTIAGHAGGEAVLLTRRGEHYFAVSGACTHYGAALAGGLIEGDQVHCPWHHACFNLLSGEAVAAPAFQALKAFDVEVEADRLFVRRARSHQPPKAPRPRKDDPRRIVIVGGGAAGFAAADMLRRRGFGGDLTMLSGDAAGPYDRPNLSKDYLAGTAPEEWIPLKDEAFYRDAGIALHTETHVTSIDVNGGAAVTAAGANHPFDVLLLATGASPVRLNTPGFDKSNVFVLRTLADARAIIAAASGVRKAAVVGASFIGLETAAALRTRGLEVDVVAPERVPLQRVMGDEIGGFIQSMHESRGVRFHLQRTAERFDGKRLWLSDGGSVEADLVILGVGVRPNIELAREAGLAIDNGVLVDGLLRTSSPRIFAAGDIASYPDAVTGERIRVEHWVAAERQGQAAAVNMLGAQERFTAPPFFWSHHYDSAIRYVGHAKKWDAIEIDGSIDNGEFTARFMHEGRLLATASLGRDRDNLEAELMLTQHAQARGAEPLAGMPRPE
jgi:NADPH-dependent 2,4-dienoyl-CoA reductase/sulfur reductase-like enzyme/nitrite reductase/ring-hydroxylating ferredoxin subunit